MSFRCCVCDMDGTVLNSQNQLVPEVRDSLLDLKKRGIQLVLATGRTSLQIREYKSVLQIDTPLITCNGGVITDGKTGKVLAANFFSPERAKSMVAYATVHHLDFLLYSTDYVYHSIGSSRINKFLNYNKTVPEKFRVPIRPITDLPSENPYQNIVKMLVTNDLSIMPTLQTAFNSDQSLALVSSGANLIDIMPGQNTSKGAAVIRVCEILGISPEDTAAFGDSPNDLSMFNAVGFSVAMGNATDEVKAAADYITTSCDENGVAEGLRHILSL